jgi:RHS repeat-associated protein
MPNRTYAADSTYRYGFNGKENDNDVKGEGNQQDYGFRIYDPRLGRFLSVDPITADFPWNSSYAFAEGDIIRCIDLDGLEKFLVEYNQLNNGVSKIKISAVFDVERQIQRLDIKPKPNFKQFKNDITKDVLRITNYQRFVGKKSKPEENTDNLNGQEKFIAGKSHVDRESFPANTQFNVVVEQGNSVIAEGKFFDGEKFVRKNVYGYIAASDVELFALDTYTKTIDRLLSNIEKEKGSKSKDIYIVISHDQKLDRDSYRKLLKAKYGENVKIDFIKNSNENKVSKRNKGKGNANITITVTN